MITCFAPKALQHSFFDVDPEDQEKVPEFATMQQRPIQPVDELEEVIDHDDDYLFDDHYRFDRHDYERPTFGSYLEEGCPSWIANEPMDSEDMYWYFKEGMDYIYDGAHRNFWGVLTHLPHLFKVVPDALSRRTKCRCTDVWCRLVPKTIALVIRDRWANKSRPGGCA